MSLQKIEAMEAKRNWAIGEIGRRGGVQALYRSWQRRQWIANQRSNSFTEPRACDYRKAWEKMTNELQDKANLIDQLPKFLNQNCGNCGEGPGHNWVGLIVDEGGRYHVGNGNDENPCPPFGHGDTPYEAITDGLQRLAALVNESEDCE